MKKIGLLRCRENVDRCPLTGCLRSLETATQGFALHKEPQLTGVLTCRCPGGNAVNAAKILKSKGAEVIHFCTCAFSKKKDGKWVMGDGFCDHLEKLMARVSMETGLPCVKGSAHLPEGYTPEIFDGGKQVQSMPAASTDGSPA
jgi:predicted metal-binding protein